MKVPLALGMFHWVKKCKRNKGTSQGRGTDREVGWAMRLELDSLLRTKLLNLEEATSIHTTSDSSPSLWDRQSRGI